MNYSVSLVFKTYLFYLDCEANYHNLFKSLSSPIPVTNQYWCHNFKGIMAVTSVGFRTHDPEVARQTPYPSGQLSA